MSTPAPWLRPREVAELLRTNVSRIIELINRGELEAVDTSREPGKGRPRWLIPPEALERYQQRRSSWRGRVEEAPAKRRRTQPTARTFV